MPFIGDEELDSLQKQIDISLEEKQEYEYRVTELEEDLAKQKKSSLFTNVIFGILSGLGIGFALYLFLNGGSGNIEQIKYAEKQRVIDSLSAEQEELEEDLDTGDEEEYEETTDADTAAQDVKEAMKDQKVYSVQIKAFTDNKYPVLSKALAVLATQSDYYKYSIGVFNSLEEAHELRKELVRIGFRDAFVASYVNGERQAIHKPGEK